MEQETIDLVIQAVTDSFVELLPLVGVLAGVFLVWSLLMNALFGQTKKFWG